MQISREMAVRLNHIFNDWLPPILRDAPWLKQILLNAIFRNRAYLFDDFRERFCHLSDKDLQAYYVEMAQVNWLKDTDLNKSCISLIEQACVGETVLEVGCGRGFLSSLLSEKFVVFGADFVLDETILSAPKTFHRVQSGALDLPFGDQSFDTTVCTHVLEHIPNLDFAIEELRRVTKRKLIIVVPRERPYAYGFNLHVHFFPYAFSFESVLQKNRPTSEYCLKLVDGDWFYVENLTGVEQK
jgi:SAM-dependent methyltransferase